MVQPQGEMNDLMFHNQHGPPNQGYPVSFQPGGSMVPPSSYYSNMVPTGQNVPGGYQFPFPEQNDAEVPGATFGIGFTQMHDQVNQNFSDWGHSL
jgi:hypothetical protein